jgi:DNA-binding IclR family transcriptional regulator
MTERLRLTRRQIQILWAIKQNGRPMRQKALGTKANGLPKGTIYTTINRMVEMGLVAKDENGLVGLTRRSRALRAINQ